MLVPVCVVGLSVLAVWKARQPNGGTMTPNRKVIYENALLTVKDPQALNKLADAFQEAGLDAEASVLRKRANLRSLPKEQKEARRQVFQKALKSDNVDAILKIADAFERETATGSAAALREYANTLSAAKEAKP